MPCHFLIKEQFSSFYDQIHIDKALMYSMLSFSKAFLFSSHLQFKNIPKKY